MLWLLAIPLAWAPEPIGNNAQYFAEGSRVTVELTLVAGLARWLVRQGARVAPFKPQNMALNSAVTVDGGEIGRAQALQALAARVPATTDMNPVLLKPSSDTGAQIIIHGRVRSDMDARAYHQYKPIAFEAVRESFERLRADVAVAALEV